ncbi:cell wall hydrolase [Sandarakinorhabdus rubra]|uniref:cell wall hydrolase n=1 Tax=Sandarakinorhabdus rubra TaxID=2672568 RepID=UPI0013DD48F4|nr:cell wall hydrolase [Sandarakinorhabdus rubra]
MLAAAAVLTLALGMGQLSASVGAETLNSQTTAALAQQQAVLAESPESTAEAGQEAKTLAETGPNQRHVECVAKVVHHEAANQPLKGQIAVAQVLVNRVNKGFGKDVCAVANQPGQFFRLNRYHPDRDSSSWSRAVDVARAVLAGEARDHSNGALFFHANWASLNGFFRTRTRVASVEDHDFYR